MTSTDPDAERARGHRRPRRTVPFDLDQLAGYDGIVVASPTPLHLEQARAAVATGAAVLVEKPLAERADGVDELVAGGRATASWWATTCACTAHRGPGGPGRAGRVGAAGGRPAVVRQLAARLAPRRWTTAPPTRPGPTWAAACSTTPSTSSTWPCGWAGPTCGWWPPWSSGSGPLEIDVEDTVRALLRRSRRGRRSTIELDYLSRRYRRGIEVIGTEATVRLDWSRGRARAGDAPSGVEVDAGRRRRWTVSYEREAQAFLDLVRGQAPAPVDGATGAGVAAAGRGHPGRRPDDHRRACVQARMGSTRLPGKVLMDLGGRPMLVLMLERLAPLVGRGVDQVVVATSTAGLRRPGGRVAAGLGAPVVRGSEADVLGRFLSRPGSATRPTRSCA